MKKLLIALLFVLGAGAAHAAQLTGAYVTQMSTAVTNQSVVLTTPTISATAVNCIQHLTVTASQAATLSFTPASTGVAEYQVLLATATPFDTQWSNNSPYCGPPGNKVTVTVSGGTYTLSMETFVYKGTNP